MTDGKKLSRFLIDSFYEWVAKVKFHVTNFQLLRQIMSFLLCQVNNSKRKINIYFIFKYVYLRIGPYFYNILCTLKCR